MDGNRRFGADRFGNPQIVRKLFEPKGQGSGSLMIGYIEIKGQLYRVTVTAAREKKSAHHVGWISVTQHTPRGGSGGGGGFRRSL